MTVESVTPRRLHTSEQAADVLQCTKSWLQDQARQRRIPFTMIAGSYRFTDEHIAEIIRIYEQHPEAETGLPVRRRPEAAPVNGAGLRARPPRRTRLVRGERS